MHDESKQDQGELDAHAEHLLVLDVAGVRRGRERERIYHTLHGLEPSRIDAAIESLRRVGVVLVKGQSVHQSPALERIDRLDMIGV
jgi:hypothetical protein